MEPISDDRVRVSLIELMIVRHAFISSSLSYYQLTNSSNKV